MCCEHRGINCEDCSLVCCPMTNNVMSCLELITCSQLGFKCHQELPSRVNSDCIWMHFNICFSTVEMNWLLSHCPCQMLFYSSWSAVYDLTCGIPVWSPLPVSVRVDTRISFHLKGILGVMLWHWTLCSLEVVLGACPWVGGFSVGEKWKRYFCESKALLCMCKSKDFS